MANNGDLDAEVTHIQSGWKNGRGCRGFCLTEDESQDGNDVRCRDMGREESTREEMRMLRWMGGVTKVEELGMKELERQRRW